MRFDAVSIRREGLHRAVQLVFVRDAGPAVELRVVDLRGMPMARPWLWSRVLRDGRRRGFRLAIPMRQWVPQEELVAMIQAGKPVMSRDEAICLIRLDAPEGEAA